MENRNTSAAWCACHEEGFILWETLLALPLLALLLMSVTAIFCWCMRAYFYNLADAELVQEVQGAFVRVTEEVLAGKAIKPPLQQRQGIEIISRQNPLYVDSVPGREVRISYSVHKMDKLQKLVRSSDDAPLTGNHSLASVTIVEFSAVRDAVYPDVYRLRLTGRSEVTKHEYTMCTAVYLPRR
ncbi:MAG: hypothetical protein K6F95_07160 [Selenomonas sp.]|uniref:hypothetical protein n=1 Tax=Selenomonas sp. TaxID=2053611 RepID=UPI0025EB7149|nr:hypothetical protein [Selenomonas sp.]MCR5757669.1 hypothetical protein [Selenomonas sp.]